MKTAIFEYADLKSPKFRFLYGRWKLQAWAPAGRRPPCSDSSMVDENEDAIPAIVSREEVQIPLWSMKTYRAKLIQRTRYPFRFLYGRWKQTACRPFYPS